MNKKITFLSCLALLGALTASAVPAKRNTITVTQPDGTTLNIRKIGDEHQHVTVTDDNSLVTRGDDGFYYYKNFSTAGVLENTGVRVSGNAESVVADKFGTGVFKKLAATNRRSTTRRRAQSRAIAQNGMGLFTCSFPRTGDVKSLVILVQYTDKKFTISDPKAFYTDMLNKEGFSQYSGTGSARDYFLKSSMDQFRPTFDVFGPVTLSHEMAYYGANDYDDYDMRPYEMVIEACKALDSDINFADYDLDGDGYVDNVYIFYAGYGEASYDDEDTVWPHSADLNEWSTTEDYSFKLDGKTISHYACSNEMESINGTDKPDGIGTFCHEFSHVMGLPDLYDVNYEEAAMLSPNAWSVLDYACYNNDSRTPMLYGIYERNAMGWMEPTVLDSPASISLEDITTSNKGYIVTTDKTNEFFLFENRQQEGTWNKYLPGHGMLIWHIDYDKDVFDKNEVNISASKQYVDIVEANGSANLAAQTLYNQYLKNNSESTYYAAYDKQDELLDGYPWPGTTGNTSFTSTTTPAFKTFNGKAIDAPITDIAETNGTITFDFMGGANPIGTPAPKASEIGDDYFVASWDACENATDYLLTVKSYVDGVAASETYDGNTLPDGWTTKGVGTYTSNSNYGVASPSIKLSKESDYVLSKEYSGDVTKISYWAKNQPGNGAASTKLNVLGLVGNAWVTISSSTHSTKAATYTFESEIPAGVRQVKFTITKSNGNMAVDDIVITYGGAGWKVLDNYDGISTNGATSYRVDKLVDGVKKYQFTVTATDGSRKKASEPVEVTLTGESGIDDIVIDDNTPARYYNLNGVAVPAANLTNGIYIKVTGTKAEKVYVK
jgi:M6 family metalloprotease-like protein